MTDTERALRLARNQRPTDRGVAARLADYLDADGRATPAARVRAYWLMFTRIDRMQYVVRCRWKLRRVLRARARPRVVRGYPCEASARAPVVVVGGAGGPRCAWYGMQVCVTVGAIWLLGHIARRYPEWVAAYNLKELLVPKRRPAGGAPP